MKESKMKNLFHNIGKAFQAGGSRFETAGYDPETQYPVIRGSICTGERVAGFKNKTDGKFTEVMLIRSPKDEQRFKEMYNVDKLDTEY